MISVDFHSHTFFSQCGIHTHIEMLTRARDKGMRALAVTDHGPAMNSRIVPPFFDRLENPVEGIRLIKGIECNVFLDAPGTIDVPKHFGRHLELILVGIHPNVAVGRHASEYTSLLVAAIEANPCIDVISHPDEKEYPLNFEILAESAKQAGVALELNNSKSLYKRSVPAVTLTLIQACKKVGCCMAISSDAHAIHEIGCDEQVRPLLEQVQFPEELIVNSTPEKAFAFIAQRRKFKQLLP
ncbi:MAG: PHP domain-containing protein [Chitinivibrionales bacterium]|nr:PHP domain-containing protein [Chitinivibrionales bacterium]